MVQSQLAERIFLARILLRRLARCLHFVEPDRDAERRIRFRPHLGSRPIGLARRTVDDGIERRVVLSPFEDVLRFLVRLVADGLRVRPRRRDEEIQRLHAGIARALRHDVEELPVRLRVELVEHHAVDVEAMLRIRLGGEDLIKAVRRKVHHALLRCEDFHAPRKRRAHPYHVRRDLEHDARLLPVGGAAIHFGTLLPITTTKEQRDGRSQLRLALLFRNLDVRRVELAVAVRLQHAEQIANDALLPVDELERLPRPRSFRMAKALDERHGKIRRSLVVMRVLLHETRRRVIFELPQFPSSFPRARPPAFASSKKPPDERLALFSDEQAGSLGPARSGAFVFSSASGRWPGAPAVRPRSRAR